MKTPTLSPPTAPEPIPPEEKFWTRYSPRLEFSISSLASITIHVVLFLLFFLIVGKLMNIKANKGEIPFKTMAISDRAGDDDVGSKGSGGGAPVDKSDDVVVPQTTNPEVVRDLEKVKISVTQWLPEMAKNQETIDIVANSPAREKLEKMDQGLRNELLKGIGSKKGAGNGPGEGTNDEKGAGQGGDSDRAKSRKRALGWNLQFNTRDSRNYLEQLAAMKATLLFQKPGSDGLENAIIFPDLSQGLKPKRYTKDMNLSALFFIDSDPSSFKGVAEELKLEFTPPQMVVLFPKDVEDELARKAMTFRNKREEDILSTTFQILFANGKFEIRVTHQTSRK